MLISIKMSDIKVIQGEIFKDHRGVITSMNDLSFAGIERFYVIKQDDPTIARGWHGHQFEKKWFYCLKGSFKMAFVKIDNWEKPSKDLVPEVFYISDQKSEIICVPEGYANCLQSTSDEAQLLVFSGKTYPECLEDSWRYEVDYWGAWDTLL